MEFSYNSNLFHSSRTPKTNISLFPHTGVKIMITNFLLYQKYKKKQTLLIGFREVMFIPGYCLQTQSGSQFF